MQKGVEFLLALPRFAYLKDLFSNRKNPSATRPHYALAEIENKILEEIEADLNQIPSVSINILMFDGVIIVGDLQYKADIEGKFKVIGDKWKVAFSLEVWWPHNG